MPDLASYEIAYSGLSYRTHINKTEFAFQKVDYEDGLEGVELLTNIGAQNASARTRGVYKPKEVSITQLRAEWDRMMKHFPKNGFGNFRFSITVSGVDPELPGNVDRILNCTILGQKHSVEATGKAGMIEFKAQPQQIIWSGRSVNFRPGRPRVGQVTA
jgi:hypothetical protein